jgi:hypothetical protein
VSALKMWLKRRVGARRWKNLLSRRWQLWRAIKLDHSALELPWLARPSNHNVAAVHALARQVDWKHATHLESRIALWAVSAAWPLVSLMHILPALRANGRFVRRVHGVNTWRQAWQMAYLATRCNCPPDSYYKFGLFKPDRAARIVDYVHHYEICNVLPELNAEKPTHRLGDKQEFHLEATRLQLPVPPVVAAFRDGKVERWFTDDQSALPERDLVLKAFDLNCGTGFERWHHTGSQTWSNGGAMLDASALVERCLARSWDHGCLIQERMLNHPAVEALTGPTLSTVRVVTYRQPNGPISVLMATIRMSTKGVAVDNFAAGGIAAPVDLRSGILGTAIAKDLTRGAFTTHPDTGHPIVGTVLPAWSGVKALAVRAHEQFGWIAFVGWDVAITPDGPVLIEANPTWCVDLVQISHGLPLGQTAFADVFSEHWREKQTRSLGSPEHAGIETATLARR